MKKAAKKESWKSRREKQERVSFEVHGVGAKAGGERWKLI